MRKEYNQQFASTGGRNELKWTRRCRVLDYEMIVLKAVKVEILTNCDFKQIHV
jgi:hypothetical protein